ncbi:Bug family tripartite tricarboxylate transporter substrate binding protein [Marinobacter sp. F3R08]|uniref:Bug family tripartite tricarboxylate transporter substrate binding protein n=1 Tax=Marinobacter sp. F3R08 TaxID=2841559 RepID=UPI001C092D64|nr:tripartite tricarboxylate transporter substrate binding protein [Marinobacter sp. F3R08]MBU2956004.1 tripartite tricarboxylate transporter substrate binding protein [Marinobacter sp. F3R08]
MSTLSKLLYATVLTIGASIAHAADSYPVKPITLIVPWSAGGGSDAVGRQFAMGLQEELGQPVNVVNKTGGAGVIGHMNMKMARPDGYTLGLGTAEIATYKHIGTADISYTDFTPISLLNVDYATFTVNAESPWKNLDDALNDLKDNPNTYTVSGSAPGAAYHLSFAGFIDQQGIDPQTINLVPSEGAAPGLQELAANGVDIVFNSLPETQPMNRSGRTRTLAVLSNERLDRFPDVASAKEVTGDEWTQGSWRGLVGPANLPDDVTKRLEVAAKKVFNSESFQSFMVSRGFGPVWADAEGFEAYMKDQSEKNAVTIQKLGLAN